MHVFLCIYELRNICRNYTCEEILESKNPGMNVLYADLEHTAVWM